MANRNKINGSDTGDRWIWLMVLLFVLGVIIFVNLNFLEGTWGDWIQPTPIVSLFGLVFGFLLLHWQLKEQYANTLEADRVQAQDRIRVDIYREIATRIESAGPHFARLITLPLVFMIELKYRIARPMPPESQFSFESMHETLNRSSEAIITFLTSLESYEIVMPEFIVFRKQFGSKLQDLNSPLSEFIQSAGLLASPKRLAIKWPPDSEDITKLEALVTEVSEIGHDLQGLTMDLRVDAQNYLLGDIFPNRRVPPRHPGDPSTLVTTIQTASD